MDDIQEILSDYFKSWNEGFISKNGNRIRSYMSEKFVGYWAHSNIDKPDMYYHTYDLNNVLKKWIMLKKVLKLFHSLNVKMGKNI